MTIRIVTDSTCDLPAGLVEQSGITVLPLFINMEGRGYRDGVDISREAFYQRLPALDTPPTTAAPGPEIFRQTYENLAAQGADQILSIHISKSLSATVDVARTAAQETTAAPVTVLDSGQLSLGLGFAVETAARLAAQGQTLEKILAAVNEQLSRTHVFAALDTVEYLRRSGRMSWALAGLASLLRIKPLLKMHLGQPTSERVRTASKAARRLLALLSAIAPLERVALVHSRAAGKAETLRQQAAALLPSGETLFAEITPVLGAHLGPGAVGFAVIEKAR